MKMDKRGKQADKKTDKIKDGGDLTKVTPKNAPAEDNMKDTIPDTIQKIPFADRGDSATHEKPTRLKINEFESQRKRSKHKTLTHASIGKEKKTDNMAQKEVLSHLDIRKLIRERYSMKQKGNTSDLCNEATKNNNDGKPQTKSDRTVNRSKKPLPEPQSQRNQETHKAKPKDEVFRFPFSPMDDVNKKPKDATTTDITTRKTQNTPATDVTTKKPQDSTTTGITTKKPQDTLTMKSTNKKPPDSTTTGITNKYPQDTTTTGITNKKQQDTTTTAITNKKPQDTTTIGITNKYPQDTTTPGITNKYPQDTTTTGITNKKQQDTTTTGITHKKLQDTTITDISTKKPKDTTTTDITTKKPDKELTNRKPYKECTDRKPIIKTVRSKNTSKIFKAVTFGEARSQPKPLRINIPTNEKASKIIVPNSKVSKSTDTVALKPKNSQASRQKPDIRRKNVGKRIRKSSPPDSLKFCDNSSPPTEVAKWAPCCINRHTKPYYEAWVNTTLAAISKSSKKDQLILENQSIIQSFQRALEERAESPELIYEKLRDERYTGRIRVIHK